MDSLHTSAREMCFDLSEPEGCLRVRRRLFGAWWNETLVLEGNHEVTLIIDRILRARKGSFGR